MLNFADNLNVNCFLVLSANSFLQTVWNQVRPDKMLGLIDTLMIFLKDFVEKVDFEEKNQQITKNMKNYPVSKLSSGQVLITCS